jgi:hypothetical protein
MGRVPHCLPPEGPNTSPGLKNPRQMPTRFPRLSWGTCAYPVIPCIGPIVPVWVSALHERHHCFHVAVGGDGTRGLRLKGRTAAEGRRSVGAGVMRSSRPGANPGSLHRANPVRIRPATRVAVSLVPVARAFPCAPLTVSSIHRATPFPAPKPRPKNLPPLPDPDSRASTFASPASPHGGGGQAPGES